MCVLVSIIFRWPFGANSSQGTHPLGQDNIITLLFFVLPTVKRQRQRQRQRYRLIQNKKTHPLGKKHNKAPPHPHLSYTWRLINWLSALSRTFGHLTSVPDFLGSPRKGDIDNLCDNHLGRLAGVMFDVTWQNFWGRAGEDSSQHCDSSPLSSAPAAAAVSTE